jgi:twitching motility protein PilU
LLRLFKAGTISLEDALQNSDSPNNLKLKINLSEGLGSASPVEPSNAGKADLLASLSLQAIHEEEEEEVENKAKEQTLMDFTGRVGSMPK